MDHPSREQIRQYLDHELSPAQTAEMADHFGICEDCNENLSDAVGDRLEAGGYLPGPVAALERAIRETREQTKTELEAERITSDIMNLRLD